MSSVLPLEGIRVLDLSRILAGPSSAMTLGDLGADVIKIEHPERGDDTRDWGARIGKTETAYFNSVNRNKRSVAVDLQTQEGRRIVQDLAKQCDVVIENFKLGGAEKFGLGYEQLSETNRELIYCSISGYDRHGPEASRPGYDLVVQGEAGLMAMNGEAEQPPLKFGVAVVDLFTGMYAAQAMLAALFERSRTGQGRRIDLALFDCGVMITAYYGLEALVRGEDPPRYGNAHPSIVPYGVFDAADGPLVITVGNTRQFERFCRDVIGREDLMSDPRFATNTLRSANRAVLLPEIERALRTQTRASLLERLTRSGIPCGEVAGLRDALMSDRTREGGLIVALPHTHDPSVFSPVFVPPWRFDGERLPVRHAPPQLGEATGDVLGSWLCLSDSEISRLQERGVAR